MQRLDLIAFRSISGILALSVCSLLVGRVQAGSWTLEEAVQTALTNNPSARLAQHRIAAAQAGLAQANAAFWPQLQFNAGYAVTDNPMRVFGAALNQRRFDFGMDFNDVPDADNLNVNGQLVVPLYRGGKSAAARQEATSLAKSARHADEAVRQTLTLEVVRAFLSVHKTADFIRATEAGVQAFESNLLIARRRYEAGQALKQDVLDVEVRLAQAREDLVQARNANALALQALNNLVADETRTVDAIVETPLPWREPAADTTPHRPELLALARQSEAAEAAMRQARSGYLPRVDAFGRYDYDHGWKFDGSGDSYTAGIQLQWDLWDGQLTRGRVQEARAARDAAAEQERQARLAIELEISQARLNLREATQRLEVTARAVDLATESAQLSRARFEQGLALASQVIDAETALTAARVRRAEAETNRLIAIANLRKALGLPPLSSDKS